jgi:hypothetical protein
MYPDMSKGFCVTKVKHKESSPIRKKAMSCYKQPIIPTT